MSTHLSRLRRSVIPVCCMATMLFASAAAAAIKTPGDLRVVNSKGKTLAEHAQYTGTTKVQTSRKADCFGDGTGGSGNKARLPGSTALGILEHARKNQRKLAPLLVSDHFSFGLALCGIGGDVAPQTGYWYLKQNHKGSQLGGDQTTVNKGDDILWYLITDFNDPLPDELSLKAPARVKPGADIPVEVSSYDDAGNKTPAAGAEVGGVTTDADGEALVPQKKPVMKLKATREGSITSNSLRVCGFGAKQCPRGQLSDIRGTNRPDKMRATGGGPDVIRAYGGADWIDIRKALDSAPPVLKCGAGKDTVIARKGQELGLAKACERIKRKGR